MQPDPHRAKRKFAVAGLRSVRNAFRSPAEISPDVLALRQAAKQIVVDEDDRRF